MICIWVTGSLPMCCLFYTCINLVATKFTGLKIAPEPPVALQYEPTVFEPALFTPNERIGSISPGAG